MEPIRAFPQFVNSLLPLLKANPDLVAEIAGEDSIHYGGNAPQGFASWGKGHCQLSEAGLQDRVKCRPSGLNDYVSWLQSSHCHVHLSHPCCKLEPVEALAANAQWWSAM